MNMPPAEGLGPTTVLDAIAPKEANLRESPARGDSFERLLGDSRSRPSQSPASKRCADESCDSEPSVQSASEVEDAELAAQEPGESASESGEDQPTDAQGANAAAAANVPVIPRLELSELAGSGSTTSDETLLEAEEVTVPSVGVEIAGASELTAAAVATEQTVVSADVNARAEHPADAQSVLAAETAHQPTELKEHGEVVAAFDGDESESGPESKDRDGELNGQTPELHSGDSPVVLASEQHNTAPVVEQAKPDNTSPSRPDASQQLVTATSNASLPQSQQPNRLPAEVLVAASSRPGSSEQSIAVDSARLLQRVARAFAAAQDGGGEVRLRLSPPELGALRLDVRVQDGAMVARMETETSAARIALIENLPALRERLAEQGVRIERFDVDLMRRDATGTPDRPADRQPPEQTAPQTVARTRRMPQVAEGVVARSTLSTDQDVRRLNVVI